MIEVEHLSEQYGQKLAVDGLDFVVQPGVVTCFLGPNGAGKTTPSRFPSMAGPFTRNQAAGISVVSSD